MKRHLYKILPLLFVGLMACSSGGLFTGYQREEFPVTPITGNSTTIVQLLNNSDEEVQHVLGIGFYSNTNKAGHFRVTDVRVGDQTVGLEDLFIPPNGVLNLELTYAPLNLEGSELGKGYSYSGKSAVLTMSEIAVADSDEDSEEDVEDIKDEEEDSEVDTTSYEYEPVIHETMLLVAYDNPSAGYAHIELVGGAVPGPNGEVATVGPGMGVGDCAAGGTTACFAGTFSIDLPGIMAGGAKEVPLAGPIPFTIDGSSAALNMEDFPSVLLVLKGNGPGEPLEGKPVDAISIVIGGTPEVVGKGSFDGRNLDLSGVDFRIRVLLGEITYDDITPGLAAAADFNTGLLKMTTVEPFDNGKIVLGVETTLSANPSGNALFDQFLGGAKVVVRLLGTLELP